MGVLDRLRGARHERAGFMLYGAAVAAARAPYHYQVLGVPDTLDGRFDLVSLHVALLVARLRVAAAPGPALAQAVFDAMFSDMDITLREMGVGDLSVGKRVRVMWEAFHGRASAYEAALEEEADTSLVQALLRNVWRGAVTDTRGAEILARLVRAQAHALAEQPLVDLAAGRVTFLPAEPPS